MSNKVIIANIYKERTLHFRNENKSAKEIMPAKSDNHLSTEDNNIKFRMRTKSY